MANLRLLATGIFALLVLALPWPFGGNWPFVRLGIAITGMVLLLSAILWQISQRSVRRTPLVWLPLLLGVVLIAGQLGNWSPGSLPVVPFTNPDRPTPEALSELELSQEAPSRDSISISPPRTRKKLAELILAIGVLFAATVFLADEKSINQVFLAITICGVAVGFFGLLQKLAWNGLIYWTYPSPGIPFGSLISKNSAAGFLILSLGTTIFLIAQQMIRWKRKNEPGGLVLSSDEWDQSEVETGAEKLPEKMLKFVAQVETRNLYVLAASVIIIVGIVASLSRGGMMAMCGTIAVAMVLLGKQNRILVGFGSLAILALGLGLVIFSEQTDSILGKLESLADVPEAASSRLSHWQDAIPFGQEHWLFGTGAGTYRLSANAMQSFFFEKTFAHAENVFIETFVEMGIIGLVLLLAVVALLAKACWNLFRRRETFDRALGIAGFSVLVGLILASILDFGIYLPANACVMAVIAGAIVGRDCNRLKPSQERSSIFSRGFVVFGLVFAAASAGWAAYQTYGFDSVDWARIEMAAMARRDDPFTSRMNDKKLDRIESALSKALEIHPDDSEAHFQLGEYFIMKFRIKWARQLAEAVTADPELTETIEGGASNFDAKAIWNSTNLSNLHREVSFARRVNPQMADQLVADPQIQDELPYAFESFKKSSENCSRPFKTQIRLAQLSTLFSPDKEFGYIEAALARNYWNSQVLFDCGLLSLNSGKQALAADLWGLCLSNRFTRKYEEPIIQLSMSELSLRDLFERVLPQSPKELLRIVPKYFDRPELTLPKQLLLRHIKGLIASQEMPEIDRHYYLAEALRLGDECRLACDSYREALELDPSKTTWRFNYANCLYQIKQYDESVRQLKKCELEKASLIPRIKGLLKKIRSERVNQPVQ